MEQSSAQSVGGESAKKSVKPWVLARASFRVQAAPKGVAKNRRIKLSNDIDTLGEGISRAPYVDVVIEGKKARALVDTGADWSLLDADDLTDEEMKNLGTCDAAGQGVGREPINIVGEVWRDIVLGGTQIPKQRFIVVRNMVTKAILGADFWVRIGEMSLNFKDRKLKVDHLGIELQLYETDEQKQPEPKNGAEQRVNLLQGVDIPPFSEKVITGRLKKGFNGCNMLIQPVSGEDNLCSVPYTVCRVQDDTVMFRVANVSDKTVRLTKDDQFAVATPKVEVLSQLNRARKKNTGEPVLDKVTIGDGLTKQQRNEVETLLTKYQNVFYDGGELPLVKVEIEHKIRLKGDSGPIAFHPRRLSREAEKEVRQEVNELIRMGVIRPSNSPWAAPIVCARRQDGSLRLALDYRALNAASLPATLHPIPRIDDLMDRLSGAKYFAVLDAKCGYHQMPLCKEEAEMTAFVVPWAHFEFTERTPFGLKGAGYSFQRFMSVILGECNFLDAICYLDDVLVWRTTWKEFITRLGSVLRKISDSGLVLSAKKCSFGVEEVMYLGAVVKDGMLCIGEQRTEQLRALPIPGSVEELRKVLGAFAYVQRWLPGIAEVARPMYDLITKTGQKKFQWNKQCDEAFSRMKDLVANAVALRIPRDDLEFTVVTDASDTGTGAMLAQKEDGVLVPVSFYHHALTAAERKYDTTEKELLAVVLACKKWRIYLVDRAFNLITDHNALRWLNTLDAEDARGRRGRWFDFLQQFEINPVHKKGKSSVMSMADYLSRVTPDGGVKLGVAAPLKMKEYTLPVLVKEHFQVDRVRELQRGDVQIMRWITTVQKKDWDTVKEKPSGHDRMFLDDEGILRVKYNGGKITKKYPFGKREMNRVVFPKSLCEEACTVCHDSPLAGHMGIRRTWQRVRDTFWWEDMKADVTDYVNNCERCGVNKHSTQKGEAPIQKTDIPVTALDKLQVDFVGPFGVSEAHEYRYALQIQDVLSRYVVFVPTIRNDAETAATTVFDEWVCKFGFPLMIQSDQGRHFTGQVFRRMCQLNGMDHVMGSAGHAQSQGQVERQNQLLNQVRALCDNKIDAWPSSIYRIQHAHNIAKNETTGISPHEVMFGQQPRAPEASMLMMENEREDTLGRVNAVEGDANQLQSGSSAKSRLKEMLVKVCRENIMAEQQKREDNQEVRGVPYKVGDLVRVRLNTVQRNKLGGKKIAPRNSKPYLIVKVTKDWTYTMVKIENRNNAEGKKLVRHYNEVIPCRLKIPDIGECYWIKIWSSKETTEKESNTQNKPVTRKVKKAAVEEEHPVEVRRSTRDRKPTKRLQLDWKSKKYQEVSDTMDDDNDEPSPESGESDYVDALDSAEDH